MPPQSAGANRAVRCWHLSRGAALQASKTLVLPLLTASEAGVRSDRALGRTITMKFLTIRLLAILLIPPLMLWVVATAVAPAQEQQEDAANHLKIAPTPVQIV